ncbi:YhdP family protein [Variovorax sp. OV329]|uniref:YhdP family protein n=1 Tax=Variovorax sp. OV329 TaxID=1882825 RepID=UPI0008E7A810|nr:YhdP family protein [Variovorax sp. OV329]SFM32156.1 TIGR02099 family protein [Variovorax sp. OV329]
MNVTASPPSHLLKITAVTARWALGLLVAAWLLFALVVLVLHAWIVPRIGEYRGVLEAQASRSIGVEVRIGSIHAQAEGFHGLLFPTFELRDVALLDAQKREGLKLARVVATVSPRSLFRLSFERLYVERPEVDVRLDALGKFHVAGLSMGTSETSGESRSADWVFSQREVAIEGGTVRWTDERRGAPPLVLTDVNFFARNSARRHALGLDATPPEGWGDRFSLRGQFRQPLLSTRSGNWHEWDGQVYADLPRIDVSRIGRYVSLDFSVREGNGALRVWGDVRNGQLVGGTLDMGLDSVDVTLQPALQPLVLRSLTGRIALRQSPDDRTVELSTTKLAFETRDGVIWPGGNLWLSHTPPTGRDAGRGAIKADRLDLAMLAQIADRLPLGEKLHQALARRAPQGLVDRLDAEWDGPLESPRRYQARGRLSKFAVASEPAAQADHAGAPGLSGATIDFDATQAGGSASIGIARGTLDFPGVFEDPLVPIDELTTRATWKIDGPRVQVQLAGLRFANADAQGDARLSWQTSDPATSASHSRFPGVLDLEGKLTRADGTKVHRYLPLHIPKETRDYVRDAVTAGVASTVDFKVKGDLWDMPFPEAKQGEFRIAAKLADVHYAYVPPPRADQRRGTGSGVAASSSSSSSSASGNGEPVWPALTATSGELIFERIGMKVRNARGRLAGAPGIEMTRGEAEIADLMHHAPVLKVNAQAAGPLPELLKAATPLAGPARDFASQVRAGGRADYKLQLEMPLSAMDKTKVQASIGLLDNELQITPDTPAFSQARGQLSFTENGFSLANVRARVLGGDTRVEGKGRYGGTGHDMSFRAQGVITAEGLRSQREMGWLADLGRRMSGSTAYQLDWGMRDGVAEMALSSNLQGLGMQLPSPLAKAAEDSLAFSVEKKVVMRDAATRGNGAPRMQDRIGIGMGRIATATWLRDISGAEPKVINGGIAVGLPAGESVVAPESGVLANLNFGKFDIDAWQALFKDAAGAASAAAPGTGGAAEAEASPYLPNVIALRAQELRFGGRRLSNIVLGGSRDGPLWRANVDSDELSGYVEYNQAQAGRVMARLARLRIARSEASEVESLLDQQASSLPALDIVVEDFELYGRRLGRAEVEAVNRGSGGTREWRLNRLKLVTPEATFAAQGSWAALRGETGRRTSMSFKLDIEDAGALLNRFGMQEVLRRGRGSLEGDVAWRGSPFSIDYPSMDGKLHLDVAQGQFLKAEPGIAKLLGVLSLQALPRRFTLDFRDIFSQGFAFDFIRGDASIAKGVASTNNLQMKGVNAAVLMDGSADLAHETTNLRVVVVPEINAGTAALVATAINPAIGLATFLAQYALSKPLSAAATQEFQIEGSWADPKITKVPRRQAQTENKP